MTTIRSEGLEIDEKIAARGKSALVSPLNFVSWVAQMASHPAEILAPCSKPNPICVVLQISLPTLMRWLSLPVRA